MVLSFTLFRILFLFFATNFCPWELQTLKPFASIAWTELLSIISFLNFTKKRNFSNLNHLLQEKKTRPRSFFCGKKIHLSILNFFQHSENFQNKNKRRRRRKIDTFAWISCVICIDVAIDSRNSNCSFLMEGLDNALCKLER